MFKNSLFNFWRFGKPNQAPMQQVPVLSGKQVDQEIKRLALKKLCHQPLFSKLDGLNEYDENYTEFTALGDLITQEMQNALDRFDQQEGQTAQTLEPTKSNPNDADTA